MCSVTKAEVDECYSIISHCQKEVSKRIVGQKDVIEGIIIALIAGGHVLLEGVPGLAKTLAVKTFADVSGLDFKRIQFTPDLLPADLTGTLIYEQGTGSFSVRKGPVFANLILADEINRSPAKVQSALLEAMAEHQVTIGNVTYPLSEPFFVLATQNPIEQEGTYNLPEAELDRFLLKLIVSYPSAEDEIKVVQSEGKAASVPVEKVFSSFDLQKCRNVLEAVTIDDKLVAYIVSILGMTRPRPDLRMGGGKSDIQRYISFGASPRAGIALLRCAKVHALFENRSFVLPEDIQSSAKAVLRHRLVLNYEAAADNVTADNLIDKVIELMPVP